MKARVWPSGRRVVGVLLVVVSLAAVWQSYKTTAEFRHYVECQARYNEINNVRTRILSEATDQERTAQRGADDAERLLFTDPVVNKPVRERTAAENAQLLELFRLYQESLQKLDLERIDADKARADNPVPPPPSVACG